MKRVLLLTAGFGEGHNTAARSVHEALDAIGGAEVRVGDLYAAAVPRVNKTVKVGYSLAINRAPWLWRLIFLGLDHPGWMEKTMWTAGPLREELDDLLKEFRPDVIVSTYPLYAYLYRQIQRRRLGVRAPILTIITDSVGVNSAWYRCLSDAFVVADEETEKVLVARGVPAELVHPLGFPVARYFATGHPVPPPDGPPWRLLFMPSTKLDFTLRQIRALLEVPDVALTIVTGRHARMHDALRAAGYGADDRSRLIGWTSEMPRLLGEHHAFVGKAGGAIVQEAIAAQCPFFVSHLVPGQEEGNVALLERLGAGVPAYGRPERLAAAVRSAFADDAAQWRTWKANLARVSRSDAAERIARFALDRAA